MWNPPLVPTGGMPQFLSTVNMRFTMLNGGPSPGLNPLDMEQGTSLVKMGREKQIDEALSGKRQASAIKKSSTAPIPKGEGVTNRRKEFLDPILEPSFVVQKNHR